MHHCVKKILSTGNNRILFCERSNRYGYNDLVVDPGVYHDKNNNNEIKCKYNEKLEIPNNIQKVQICFL